MGGNEQVEHNEHGGVVHQVSGVVGIGTGSEQVDPASTPSEEDD